MFPDLRVLLGAVALTLALVLGVIALMSFRIPGGAGLDPRAIESRPAAVASAPAPGREWASWAEARRNQEISRILSLQFGPAQAQARYSAPRAMPTELQRVALPSIAAIPLAPIGTVSSPAPRPADAIAAPPASPRALPQTTLPETTRPETTLPQAPLPQAPLPQSAGLAADAGPSRPIGAAPAPPGARQFDDRTRPRSADALGRLIADLSPEVVAVEARRPDATAATGSGPLLQPAGERSALKLASLPRPITDARGAPAIWMPEVPRAQSAVPAPSSALRDSPFGVATDAARSSDRAAAAPADPARPAPAPGAVRVVTLSPEVPVVVARPRLSEVPWPPQVKRIAMRSPAVRSNSLRPSAAQPTGGSTPRAAAVDADQPAAASRRIRRPATRSAAPRTQRMNTSHFPLPFYYPKSDQSR